MDETTATPPPVPTAMPTAVVVEQSAAPSVRVPVWLFAGVVGMAVGAGSVGLVWGLSPGGSAGPSTAATPAPSKSETFILAGKMTLKDGGAATAAECGGQGGYDDIGQGTPVTVFNENGKVLAKGALGAGKGKGLDGCVFTLRVEEVPIGPQFYQVEVSHRGKITLPKAEAELGLMNVELG
ncbi:hypothetical protein ACFVUH_36630 [Kitasatospora sp. NPDC058032]|uniref:hypothetical protein n=1 Tax=Kitasatospora sp. NPDC058032 TaxID=3346307 RepID=UPI0036D88770